MKDYEKEYQLAIASSDKEQRRRLIKCSNSGEKENTSNRTFHVSKTRRNEQLVIKQTERNQST